MNIQLLKSEPVRKILGKVEVETIIKKMEGKKLKQAERNYLYRSIRPKLMAAGMLTQENILKEINKDNKENESIIEYNLGLYGYEMLLLKKRKAKKLGIEELIARILIKHQKARFIEAIPILMVKNPINKFKLLELAAKYGIRNKIGYLLETALIIRQMPYLNDLLSYMEKSKDSEMSFLQEGDLNFLAKTSPKRIKKWNLLGRFFDEDFKKNAEAYI